MRGIPSPISDAPAVAATGGRRCPNRRAWRPATWSVCCALASEPLNVGSRELKQLLVATMRS